MPRVRPVSAAICAREREPEDATCRSTTPRFARRTVVWSAGYAAPRSNVIRAARGRKESSGVAICLWSGQTRPIGVPLSTATMGSDAGDPAALRSSAQASHDVVERPAVRPRAPFGGGARLRIASALGHAEREDDRRRLLLAQARARHEPRRDRRARWGRRQDPRSMRRAACSARHGRRRTRPAPCPSRRSRRRAPRRGRSPGRRHPQRAPRSAARLSTMTNVHGCLLEPEPERRPHRGSG